MKMKLTVFAVMVMISSHALSDNIIRVAAPVSISASPSWMQTTPLVSDWSVTLTTCNPWSPDVTTVNDGQSFSQQRVCEDTESRTVQQREFHSGLNEYREVGQPETENRTASRTETQEAVGTKPLFAPLKVINPVAGVDGIYQVQDPATGTTFNAYVNMNYDGGYWVLAAYWISPASLTKTMGDLVYRGNPLSTYSVSPSTYPVIPSGIKNHAQRGLLRSANGEWISQFGEWQSFNLIPQGQGGSSFPAKTSKGDRTLYPQAAGWKGGIYSAGVFGFWNVFSNGGVCGGDGKVGSAKICPSGYFPTWASHNEKLAAKFFYLKGE